MITPAKRYIVAQTTTSNSISTCAVEEIAALLNANMIQEDYVAREWAGSLPDQAVKNVDEPWVTISQLLADAYKDKPLITVVLKDVENNAVIFSERYHSDDGPLGAAFGAMDCYFAKHFKEFAQTPPKEFLLYFKSDKCPPTMVTVKLKVGNVTCYKGVIGSKDAPAEEAYPYTYDESEPRKVETSEEFPSVALELKSPKYDPAASLP